MKEAAPTRLLLVRHGQDHDNAQFRINGRRDTPLTELGQTQALAAAESLRSEKIDCVYASPLQRARQTASIIAQRLEIPELHVDDDLIERDYGILTGRSPLEIPQIARRILVAHDFKFVIEAEGAESYDHLLLRAGSVLRKIQDQHAGRTVLIAAHNEIIKMIRASFEKRSWQDELLFPPISHCQVIALEQPGDIREERTR